LKPPWLPGGVLQNEKKKGMMLEAAYILEVILTYEYYTVKFDKLGEEVSTRPPTQIHPPFQAEFRE